LPALVRLRGNSSQSAWQRNVVLAAAVIAIAAAFGLRIPAFLSVQSLFDMWQQAALLMVVSIGATFVIIAGELDLSVGRLSGWYPSSYPPFSLSEARRRSPSFWRWLLAQRLALQTPP
jgi:hypothetical protein